MFTRHKFLLVTVKEWLKLVKTGAQVIPKIKLAVAGYQRYDNVCRATLYG